MVHGLPHRVGILSLLTNESYIFCLGLLRYGISGLGVWIGASDSNPKSSWGWVDGQVFKYLHFRLSSEERK